jgi:hypothetical protein
MDAGTNVSKIKWYEVILWWELMRIPYNAVMALVGYASFYIAFVTIPLVYIALGILFNLFFTLGWVSELTLQSSWTDPLSRRKFRIYFGLGYLLFSIVITFSFSLFLIRK